MDVNKRKKRILDTGLPFSRRSLRDDNSSEMSMVEKPTMAMMEIIEKRIQRAIEKGDMRKVRGRPLNEDDGLITKSSYAPNNQVSGSLNSRTKDSDDELELNLEFPNSPTGVDETTPVKNARNAKSGRMMPLQRGRYCRLSVQKLPSFELVESVRRTVEKSTQTINIREASTESDEPLSSRYMSQHSSEVVFRKKMCFRKKRKIGENSSTSASVPTKKLKTVERCNNMSIHIIEQSDEDASNSTMDWGEMCSPINRSVKGKCGSHVPLGEEACSPFSDNSKPNVAMIEIMEKKQQRMIAELNRSRSRNRNSALFEASPSTRVTPTKTPTKPATYGIESYRSHNSTLLEASPSTRQTNRIKTPTKSTTHAIEKCSIVSSDEEIQAPSRDSSKPNAAMIEMMEKKQQRVAAELNRSRSRSRRSRNSTLIEASPRATTQIETPKKSTCAVGDYSTLDNSSVSSAEEAVAPKDSTKPTAAMLEIMEKKRKKLELNKTKSASKNKKKK